jgi:H+/Cl- antiporter ClcA
MAARLVLLVTWGLCTVAAGFSALSVLVGSGWSHLESAERMTLARAGLVFAAPWALCSVLLLVAYLVVYRWDQERARRGMPTTMWWPPGTGRPTATSPGSAGLSEPGEPERRVARHDSWS